MFYLQKYKSGKQGESFISGAFKLTVAGIIVRIMGFVNRIFMSNLIGAEGMGLYQLTFPVYSLIILTLTSGVSVTVSGLTAKYKAAGRLDACRGCAGAGFALLLAAGGVCGAVMAAFARPIAVNILGDSRTALSIALLSPCIPIVASASAIKGYFYGMSKVTPTAISQIVEQIVRIGFIFIFAGAIAKTDLTNACAIITLSSAVGEMANLLVVMIAFCTEQGAFKKKRARKERQGSFGRDMSSIIKSSLPISAGRFVTSMIGTVEAIMLPARFLKGGLNYTDSLSMLGRLSGMAMPLIMFPSVVTSAVATTLVPAISSAVSVNNMKLARKRISRSIILSLTMGFFFFSFFFVFGDSLGELLYDGENVGILLKEMSIFCVLLYLQQTMSGVLNGLDRQKEALVSTLLGSVARLCTIWFAVPTFGVDGYIAGMLFGTVITCTINLCCIIKCTRIPFMPVKWLAMPAMPAVAMASAGSLVLGCFPDTSSNLILWCFAVGVSAAVWLTVMFLTGQLNFGMGCGIICRRASVRPKEGGIAVATQTEKEFKIKN